MQTLIIRIYRRSPAQPEAVAGLVEAPATGEKSAFHSFSELLEILRYAVLRCDDLVEQAAQHEVQVIPDKQQAG
jgi:hypothetical protein